MKFGKVEDPGEVDFSLPKDHPQTEKVLAQFSSNSFENVSIGCAKWNKTDLKNFYPRGTKNELEYYSSQFNSVELNASFYRIFPAEQFQTWHDKVGPDFRFFPKVPRLISHMKRLNGTEELVNDFTETLRPLKDKLGMVFLQMPENFMPKFIDRLPAFFESWPEEIPLALELRHFDWHNDESVANELNSILMQYNISSVLTDTAGRRDLMHMRLTTPTAFIRYNGANHPTDYSRLDDWLDRLKIWNEEGLKNCYFFVHQNIENASPLLSAYFIEKFNNQFNTNIHIPKTL